MVKTTKRGASHQDSNAPAHFVPLAVIIDEYDGALGQYMSATGAGDVVVTMGDCHLYSNHAQQVETQLARQPKSRPSLQINRVPDSLYDYRFEDFELVGYDPEPNISAPVAV